MHSGRIVPIHGVRQVSGITVKGSRVLLIAQQQLVDRRTMRWLIVGGFVIHVAKI